MDPDPPSVELTFAGLVGAMSVLPAVEVDGAGEGLGAGAGEGLGEGAGDGLGEGLGAGEGLGDGLDDGGGGDFFASRLRPMAPTVTSSPAVDVPSGCSVVEPRSKPWATA